MNAVIPEWVPALFGIADLAYALATALYVTYLLSSRESLTRVALGALVVGFFAHGGALLTKASILGTAPVTNTAQGLSFFAWLVVAGFLVLQVRLRMPIAGAFVTPLAFFLVLVSLLLPEGRTTSGPVPDALRGGWTPIHVVTAFLGHATFALAAGLALMYVIQESYLRARRPSAFAMRLPSLVALDDLNYRCLAFGFPMLTLAIVTGSLLSHAAWGHYWTWDPRQVGSVAAWAVFAAALGARFVAGWRGRRAAQLTLAGFALALGSYLVIALAGVGRHFGEFR